MWDRPWTSVRFDTSSDVAGCRKRLKPQSRRMGRTGKKMGGLEMAGTQVLVLGVNGLRGFEAVCWRWTLEPKQFYFLTLGSQSIPCHRLLGPCSATKWVESSAAQQF